MVSQKEVVLQSAEGTKKHSLFRSGFISGLGWAFGVTIGFVLVSTIVLLVLRSIDSTTLFGSFIADIVEATQEQLLKRSVFSQY